MSGGQFREEQARLEMDDLADEIAEMVNLPRDDTGVGGTIYISTAQGPHGPRIKWYPGRPSRDAASVTVTLEEDPRAINHGVQVAQWRAAEAPVRQWLALNRVELLRFWADGVSWTRQEVADFLDALKKLP